MCNEKIAKIEEKLKFIEFRQDLLFYQSNVNRILYEYKVTESQYNKIMDEMDKLRTRIGRNEEISNSEFENNILEIMDRRGNIDYHFCEDIAKAFMDDGRWDEVFIKLYGHMDKYKFILNR